MTKDNKNNQASFPGSWPDCFYCPLSYIVLYLRIDMMIASEKIIIWLKKCKKNFASKTGSTRPVLACRCLANLCRTGRLMAKCQNHKNSDKHKACITSETKEKSLENIW